MRKLLVGLSLLTSAIGFTASADQPDWDTITEKARGQTVYFNAWGGSQNINAYLRWANDELTKRYGVKLEHVKVADISETVNRLVAEKTAGRNTGGSVDMVWINGENFKSMKQAGLLYGPITTMLPNWAIVNKDLPVEEDFTEPTDGLEAPWGVGQLVFIHDSATLANPPKNFHELLSLAKAHPGKITYPKPPAFHGTSFLKAALIELTKYPEHLYQPVIETEFAETTAPLWQYLDELHAVAWRNGKQFPANGNEMSQLLDDGELLLAVTFNPNSAKVKVANGALPESARTYAFDRGALSNIHFMGIPWNASSKEGALVAINFLMGEDAQLRKADTNVWGDPMVIRSDKASTEFYKSIPEPHPSWQVALEKAWTERYGH